jgi:hypothetical protein
MRAARAFVGFNHPVATKTATELPDRRMVGTVAGFFLTTVKLHIFQKRKSAAMKTALRRSDLKPGRWWAGPRSD